MARSELRFELMNATGLGHLSEDNLQGILIVAEELASNGLEHGSAPVELQVAASGAGCLVDVADGAVDQPPVPAVDRDPAHGGLGFCLVAALMTRHGWVIQEDRKHVWAWLSRAGV
jgi:two-component sensor histidine kinase